VPSSWNRSRTTALVATLLLHLLLAAWILSVKSGEPPAAIEIAEVEWVPPLQSLLRLPPPAIQPMPLAAEPVEEPFVVLPAPEPVTTPSMQFDWYGDARAAARGRATERHGFAAPDRSSRKLKSAPDGPPPLFEQPLPRVGTTVTTTEGETILWVSDYCFISLSSTSLTMGDFHAARRGIRTCIVPLGRRKPRGDLFDHLKKPPSVQPPAQSREQQ
jgi:hypothetical protein